MLQAKYGWNLNAIAYDLSAVIDAKRYEQVEAAQTILKPTFEADSIGPDGRFVETVVSGVHSRRSPALALF